MPWRRRVELALWTAAVATTAGAVLLAQPPPPARGRLYAIVAAEDARAATPGQLETLLAATKDSSPEVQRAAVRALGRLERVTLVTPLLPALRAASPDVRAEAANALAQALTNVGDDPDQQVSRVETALRGALEFESNPRVRGVLLQTIGRLPFKTPTDRSRAERLLADHLAVELASEQGAEIVWGALRGLESLYRAWPRPVSADATVLERVILAGRHFNDLGAHAGRVRKAVLMALIAAGHGPAEITTHAIRDGGDAQIRRLAVLSAALPNATGDLRAVAVAGLADSSPMVRLEALRVYGRQFQSADCTPITQAILAPFPGGTPPEGEVRKNESAVLLGLDLLGEPCPDPQPVADLLAREAASDNWRRAAHAFVSLARRAPDRARPLLARMVSHPVWQVRMYSARAAAALADTAALTTLAADANDNVRESAIGALVQVRGHAADDIYIAALARPDYQLVRTAARALQGTGKKKAASDGLAAAFARISRQRRETSRDTRLAILQRLREVGTPDYAKSLDGCLEDFDPRIAAECGLTLIEWGARTSPFTAPPAARPATPSADELAGLAGAKARIAMSGGGTFELALLTDEAPLSVARFARLARAGYYDGLTFHRVVPNFVIQGGSPGANEYAGDGPFMRDEVGLRSHQRGTLGISTRGRDTGDAQIFVNLVDNPRLDHIYTVFAEVTRGLDIVDAILEGDVIEKIEIVK